MQSKFNMLRKFLLFFLLPTLSYANNNYIVETISCPSINNIQQAANKLDTAQKVNDKYLVYTAKVAFQESSLSWFITTAVQAGSENDAIKRGREQLQQAATKEDVATKIGNDYRCKYDSGIIQAWGKILSPQN